MIVLQLVEILVSIKFISIVFLKLRKNHILNGKYMTSVVMTTKPETKSAKTVTQMMVTVAPPTAPLKT
jgi:hypothetical protein